VHVSVKHKFPGKTPRRLELRRPGVETSLGMANRPAFVAVALAVLLANGPATSSAQTAQPRSPKAPATFIEKLFNEGEAALNSGDLERAEQDFRKVLALDPQSAGAYANLGTICMRRQQWALALNNLRKAAKLAPQVAGIRLNIGLAYYRQNDFREAIPAFESVLREQPGFSQARYLLGLCYFFSKRYPEAAQTLQPLWDEQSNNLSYLYVLGVAAHKAALPRLEEQALGRLVEIGQDSPTLHLLMGKAYLNGEDYKKAIAEFERAAEGDPRLPFVHFNLGMAYLRRILRLPRPNLRRTSPLSQTWLTTMTNWARSTRSSIRMRRRRAIFARR